MVTTITPIRTGTIRIRPAHLRANMSRPLWRRRLDIITDRDWTRPLPIYTYLIDHEEGLILLDCGETAQAGFFPWWHPFFRFSVDLNVTPEDEIGVQLRALGIDPTRDLKHLVLSHLHHDHADGLDHFAGTEIIVSAENYAASKGLRGAMIGAVPSRWPSWFEPSVRELDGPAVGEFAASLPLTNVGTVFAVPTPGHMDGHLSVVVRTPEVSYFLAGDATYDQNLLTQRAVDGPSESIDVSLRTFERISSFAESEPTVLLPAHDPAAQQRLEERVLLTGAS